MSFRSKPGVNQLDIPASPEVGELIILANVGGNPALPALDGSLLTGITASADVSDVLISRNTGATLSSRNDGNLLLSSNP